MTNFRYEQLGDPRSWIRVLVLHNGSNDEPLRATLEHVELKNDVEYEAISYCWGSSEKPYCIWILNGLAGEEQLPIPITESLYHSLRRFRRSSAIRRLWNDAVCINQACQEEKKFQIRLMDQIYLLATMVLVYLGEQNASFRQGAPLMEKVYSAAMDTPADDQRRPIQWIKDAELPSILPGESWQWQHVSKFFCRPWFRRKWIIQECALAKEVVFHCGKWERNWPWMETMYGAVTKYSLAAIDWTTDAAHTKYLRSGLSQLDWIMATRNNLREKRNVPLMDLAYRFQSSEATDPRDHLFALLSLAFDSGSTTLDPDYRDQNTVLQNCLRYARHFLAKSGLQLLYRAGVLGHQLYAPSWIPDWYGGRGGNHCEYAAGPWDPLLRPSFYKSTRKTTTQVVATTDETILGLKGCIFDTVLDLADQHLQTTSITNPSKDAIIERNRKHLQISDLITQKLSAYPQGTDLVDVQWRTLICNVTKTLERAPPEYRSYFDAWRRLTLLKLINPEQMEADRPMQEPYRRVIDGYNSNKIFGMTNGGYAGMFPQATKRNDVIAFFYGGDFPFVVRRYSGSRNAASHELVGPCYIHGAMEETQLDLSGSKFTEETFLLGGDYEDYPPIKI